MKILYSTVLLLFPHVPVTADRCEHCQVIEDNKARPVSHVSQKFGVVRHEKYWFFS